MNRYIKLLLSCLTLWLFFGFIAPSIAQKSETLMELVRIADEKGIHTGALYYTNVPTSYESEMASRQAVRDGMALRRANK